MKTLELFEDMKRGGLCFVGSKRIVQANSKHIEGYDQRDCNNLYGKNMSEYLPFADLKLCNASLEETAATPENGLIGYTA